jgi:hypothetical protein
VKTIRVLHEIFHVKYARKIKSEDMEKVRFCLRQCLTRQKLQKISKVITAVKREPLDLQMKLLDYWRETHVRHERR